ncbi:hypothetical protein VB002_03585 [Campylobacter concisus]
MTGSATGAGKKRSWNFTEGLSEDEIKKRQKNILAHIDELDKI